MELIIKDYKYKSNIYNIKIIDYNNNETLINNDFNSYITYNLEQYIDNIVWKKIIIFNKNNNNIIKEINYIQREWQ